MSLLRKLLGQLGLAVSSYLDSEGVKQLISTAGLYSCRKIFTQSYQHYHPCPFSSIPTRGENCEVEGNKFHHTSDSTVCSRASKISREEDGGVGVGCRDSV